MGTATGHTHPISNLCSQMGTTALELCHVNFSFGSLLIRPLKNEIISLDPSLEEMKSRL